MTLVCVSDPGDELEHLYVELGDAKRDLHYSERAPIDGRVVNNDGYLLRLQERRQRVRDLEDEIARIRALEEADSELAETTRGEADD